MLPAEASRTRPGVDGLSVSFQRPDGENRAKKPGRYVRVRSDIVDYVPQQWRCRHVGAKIPLPVAPVRRNGA